MHRLDQSTQAKDDGKMLSGASGRKGSKKVRSGCITCKIRKVKCDEAKPYCLRCSRTGRKCDGYLDDAALSIRRRRRRRPVASEFDDPLIGEQKTACGAATARLGLPVSSTLPPLAVTSIPRLPDLLSWDSAQEKRSFDFFHHVTAPMLAGDLDAVFWRVLVLQICRTEPSVRHAILAISSLHEALLHAPTSPPVTSCGKSVATPFPPSCMKQHEFALQQYNKAIACLLEDMKMANGEPSIDISTETGLGERPGSRLHLRRPVAPLMTCLLFVCIEVIQGKDRDALIHLEQGRHLLRQFVSSQPGTVNDDGDTVTPSSNGTQQTPHKNDADPEIAVIRQHLVPLYTRLSMTSFLFGGNPEPIPSALKTTTAECTPSTFDSIHALRAAIHDFVNDILRFTQRARSIKYPVSMRRRASSSSYDSFRSSSSSRYSSSSRSSPLSPSPLASVHSPTTSPSSDEDDSKLLPNLPQASIALCELEADKNARSARLCSLRVAVSLFRVNQSAVVMASANPNTIALAVLQIHLCISEIWLATALIRAETAFDAHLELFSTIVSLAVTVLEAEQQQQKQQKPQQQSQRHQPGGLPIGASSIFTLETNIIPALYYVATKCRHGPVRHAALSLLRQNGGRRENLWRADVLGAIAARIIEVEEGYAVVGNGAAKRETGSTYADVIKEEEAREEMPVRSTASTDIHQGLSVNFGLSSAPEHSIGDVGAIDIPGVDLSADPIVTEWGFEEQLGAEDDGRFMGSFILDDIPTSRESWQESLAENGRTDVEQLQEPTNMAMPSPSSTPFVSPSGATPAPNCFKQRSAEPPFDVPEQARVHTTVIGPEVAKGRWVTLFRKLGGLEGAWDVRSEFVSS